jgi:hypothetical protein
MSEQNKRPPMSSLRDWQVGMTQDGLNEVRLVLADKDEARLWAIWLVGNMSNDL